MDEAVVDASVAIKRVFSEALSDAALDVRRQHRLLAPDLIVTEWSNILWKKVRREELSTAEAVVAGAALRR